MKKRIVFISGAIIIIVAIVLLFRFNGRDYSQYNQSNESGALADSKLLEYDENYNNVFEDDMTNSNKTIDEINKEYASVNSSTVEFDNVEWSYTDSVFKISEDNPYDSVINYVLNLDLKYYDEYIEIEGDDSVESYSFDYFSNNRNVCYNVYVPTGENGIYIYAYFK